MADDARFASLDAGFTADSTVAELADWWLQTIARHRVRPTTFATNCKQVRLIDGELGTIAARQLRPEQVAAFISDLIDRGSPSRALNVRTLLVQIMDQAVPPGLAADNVARRVKTLRVPQVRRRTITPAETPAADTTRPTRYQHEVESACGMLSDCRTSIRAAQY